MKLIADSHAITLPCPGCGQKHSKTVGWLKAHKHISCVCGARIDVDLTKFDQGIATAQKGLDDFEATLRKLGKR